MKKFLSWLLVLVVLVVVAVLVYLAYLGAFSGVKVGEAKIGPYTVAYESFVGDYKNTGKVFAKVYQSLAAEGIKTSRGLGMYYDDPKAVAPDKLRSDCGSIIEGDNLKKLSALGKKFKIKRIAQKNSLVVEFPLKSVLSYMIGPAKAYPALAQYALDKGFRTVSAMEIYDTPNKKILYVMGIKK